MFRFEINQLNSKHTFKLNSLTATHNQYKAKCDSVIARLEQENAK